MKDIFFSAIDTIKSYWEGYPKRYADFIGLQTLNANTACSNSLSQTECGASWANIEEQVAPIEAELFAAKQQLDSGEISEEEYTNARREIISRI